MTDFGSVVDNVDAGRFELAVDGRTAFAAYRRDGDSLVFTHTVVPSDLKGRGVGSSLARGALDAARAQGADVVPLCPFVAAFIRRHPAYLDLVSERNRQRLDL